MARAISSSGVALFIRQRRLRRIHALLADPHEQRMISEIAYLFGFVKQLAFQPRVPEHLWLQPARGARGRRIRGDGRHAHAGSGEAYAGWVRRVDA